jgi:bifunctional non-homologous end joining protein LigD
VVGYRLSDWHDFVTPPFMSLSLYKKKRHFNETPEPEGKEKSSASSLRFVIQKHDASHLHYDLRLEMEGVLKSWAVPKGPSLNPEDKRLAMMVEDHPYDYRNFEGIIPEGNYGAGTVIVWDEGTYEPLDGEGLSVKEQEKMLLKQLHAGSLKFIMHGKKLKGEFALFKLRREGDEKSWILLKKNDRHASDTDISLKNKSIKSGKTLAQVAKENGTEVKHPEEDKKSKAKPKDKPIQLLDEPERKAASRKSKAVSPRPPASRKASKSKTQSKKGNLPEAVRSLPSVPMPGGVKPMLATLVDAPFDSADWLFEIKWDGYRAVAYKEGDQVELISRNNKPFTEKYEPVAEALKELDISAVFDGEIVAVDEKGLGNFQMLQNWQNTPSQLRFFIFDILWLQGRDLTRLPLIERKKILQEILPEDHAVLRYSDHVVEKGNNFFQVALAQGLEGIMAKKSDSKYEIGARTDNWVKIKVNLRQEVVIAGYTEPRKSRKFFGALLLGLYRDGELVYIGHSGSGFNTKSLEQIYKKLQPLVIDDCPFAECPKGNMPVTWVKPQLVCEIKFTEWTKDGIARHPIFMGLREDKKPKDVTFEKAKTMATMKEETKNTSAKETSSKKAAPAKKAAPVAKKAASRKPQAASSKSKAENPASEEVKESKASGKKTAGGSNKKPETGNQKQVDLSIGNDQIIIVDEYELKLTNLNKLYWKKEKFSKGDMINYYLRIAPYMMPYMMNRPQSLNRHPNGIDGPNFYQKDMKGKAPEWAETFDEFSESTNVTVEYLVCSSAATLIYMANLGCIEMHPWHSRTSSSLNPDWCLIDLDPDKGNPFEQVIDTAHVVKQVLDSIGAESYVKTSGSSGIHIYIPLGAKYSFEQSKQLAELVVTMVNQELPDTTSLERSPAKRKGKIYLDYLQNRETQTAASPYSLRPKPGMPVSTPLDWSEVKKGLTPQTYHARNIFDRLKTEGDLFGGVLGKGVDLQKVLSKLASQMK